MLAGCVDGKKTSLSQMFGGGGGIQGRSDREAELAPPGSWPAARPGGSCSGMFTANSMNCLCEALGLALPGNGTVPAPYSNRLLLAKHTGDRSWNW